MVLVFSKIVSEVKTMRLMWVGLFVHVLFYCSLWHNSHFMNYFFPLGQLHKNYIGLDFFSIPGGAYSFYHEGKALKGSNGLEPSGYSKGLIHNVNPYHPVLTLSLGGLIQLFSPKDAIFLWQLLKLSLTVFIGVYLIYRFRGSKNLDFAMFLYFFFFPQYHEIKIAQYQFLLNVCLLFFLLNFNNSKIRASGFLLLSLLIKPIAVLFYPILLVKKQYKIIFLSLTPFLVLTVPFLFFDESFYYFENLMWRWFDSKISGPREMYNFSGFLNHVLLIPAKSINYVKISITALVIVLACFKRTPSIALFLSMVIVFLLFGRLSYEYYFTALIPFFVVGIITEKSWDNLWIKTSLLLCSLPSSFFVLQLLNYGVRRDNITYAGWAYLNPSRVIPALLLLILIIFFSFQQSEKRNNLN